MKPERPTLYMKTIREIKELPSPSNLILAKTVVDLEKRQTKSGVWLITDTDFNPAMHANRISEVIMVPDNLYYTDSKQMIRSGDGQESMPWQCDMELKRGDIIWHDFLDGYNCQRIFVDDNPGVEYRFLNYRDIYLAKRRGGDPAYDDIADSRTSVWKYIPLNGYVLCAEITEAEVRKFSGEKISDFEYYNLSEKIDKRFGKVVFIGKPNRKYQNKKMSDGDFNLLPGDIIIKKNKNIHILLEDKYHTLFDTGESYFIIQRKDIYAKIVDDNNS